MTSGDANPEPSTLHGRLERICRELFGGNQAAMAKDLCVSQVLISKVLRREQNPGPKLLAALVKHPRINAQWLMDGIGDAFPTPKSEPSPGVSLPVFRSIRPGDPGESPASFVALRFSILGLASPAVYLLELQPGDPVVNAPELKLAAGDLLALDTDGSSWLERPQVLTGQLVAFRRGQGRKSSYHLGQVVGLHGDESLWVKTFLVDLNEKRGPGQSPVAYQHDEASCADVVACCIMIIRPTSFAFR